LIIVPTFPLLKDFTCYRSLNSRYRFINRASYPLPLINNLLCLCICSLDRFNMSKSITFPPLKSVVHPIQKRIEKYIAEEDANSLPGSIQNNSAEEVVLEYVDNFRKQFGQLYPQRGDMLLSPKNECGIPKFISTTIRPTKIPIKKLNDYDSCASFTSDFINYEPLLEPTRLVRISQNFH
jgi:hypothetical protein